MLFWLVWWDEYYNLVSERRLRPLRFCPGGSVLKFKCFKGKLVFFKKHEKERDLHLDYLCMSMFFAVVLNLMLLEQRMPPTGGRSVAVPRVSPIVQQGQPPAEATQDVDQAVINATFLGEIQGLRDRVDEMINRIPQGGKAPPAYMQAPGLGLTHWETLSLMKDMCTEHFCGGIDPIKEDD